MGNLDEVVRENLSTRVYKSIRSALMDGQFDTGDRLKIKPLAEELGVSLTPVREAIFRLVSEQALEMRAATAVHVPERSSDDLRQINLIRHYLEGEAAQAAALNASPQIIEELEAIQDSFLGAIGQDIKQANHHNRIFHFTLAKAGGLDVVMRTIETMWAMIGPTMNAFHREVPQQELLGEHRHTAVLKALRSNNPEAAKKAIQEDIKWGEVVIRWTEKREQENALN